MEHMSKHPGPWRYEDGRFVDANGVGLTGNAPMRLILAAPALLEGMQALLSDDGPRDLTPFNLLVDYLDGKPGANGVDVAEFLKWLRTGKGSVVTSGFRDVEWERDELLAELKRVNEYSEGGLDQKALALIARIEKETT
jgi:hypothetical protein